uniref:Carn_acyltransf domain-containing protein n=1 Tax=Onchocerca volvulus TaxID=6282 RepID=A0A8R1XTM0_ONCVO
MDGHCSMTYDCTPEVSIAATLMNFICHEIKNNDFNHDASSTIQSTLPRRFSISETDKDYILQSKRNIDRIASDTDIKIFTFEHFGRDLIQKYNISPNRFIQIGMDIAYYRMYGKEACISQMATLRKFQDGRMDIIRLPSLNSAMLN